MKIYNRCIRKITYMMADVKRTLINVFIPNVSVGKNTIIEPGVILRSQYGGNISIGSDCYLSKGAQLLTHGGDISIGNNSTVNPCTIIYGQGGGEI